METAGQCRVQNGLIIMNNGTQVSMTVHVDKSRNSIWNCLTLLIEKQELQQLQFYLTHLDRYVTASASLDKVHVKECTNIHLQSRRREAYNNANFKTQAFCFCTVAYNSTAAYSVVCKTKQLNSSSPFKYTQTQP